MCWKGLQKLQGRDPSAEEVRRAILDSAIPCDPGEVDEPERCLRGRLNIPGAAALILGPPPGRGLWPWHEMAWRDVQRVGSRIAEDRIPLSQRLERGSVAVYLPTAPAVVQRMLALADPKRGEVLYDLGCGDGRLVIAAAKLYGVRAVGFDLDPARVDEAREKVRRHGVGDLVSIEQADILSLDLRGAGIITLYLQESAMLLLTPELKKLRPGARIVSHELPIPGSRPTKAETVPAGEEPPSTIYLYVAPLSFDQPAVAARTLAVAVGGGLHGSGAPVETAVPVGPASKKLVYALGTIGYDFGTESRRDTFKQLMPPVEVEGTTVPANPYDPGQTSAYLARNPSEARSLIWTLHQEQTPVYALKPVGPFGPQVYETLRLILAGQVEAAGTDAYVERVSVPGERTDRVLRLFSGQEVPVLKMRAPRGLYGWQVDPLVDDALAGAAPDLDAADAPRVRRALRSFLDKVYHELRNPGATSKDRALNFAATNAFQAAEAFARAIAERRQLKDVEVVKSPICRLHSDCWDVKLKFFDPDNGGRAKRVCRLTIDVSDLLPVTLGEVRTWMTRD